MKKSLAFIFVLLSASVYSQITLHFKDSISKKPAAYIMVLNENNEIITASNELGEVFLNKENKLTNSIVLESIFYEKKEINLGELENNTTILLTPMVNTLDEVVIPTNQKKKYLVLTAYYRGYNITDGVLRTFVDAEVKYIKKKKTFKTKVLNFRILDTVSKERQKKSNNPYWINDIKKKTALEKANSKYYLVKTQNKGIINIIGKKDKKVYGTIENESNPQHNSNIKISFRKEGEDFHTIYTEEYDSDNLLTVSTEDVKYICRIVNADITQQWIKVSPELKGLKKHITKNEIFIQNVEYITKEEYKKIMKMGYKDTSVSHYTKEFWKNLEIFSPLEPVLQKQLDEILIERK